MNLEDPFVRRICEIVFSIACLALLLIGCLSLGIVLDWYFAEETGSSSKVLARMASLLPKLSGAEANELTSIVAIALNAAPLAVTAICVTTVNNSRRVNKFGKVISIVLLLSVFASMLGYVLINPVDWGEGHQLRQTGLEEMQEWAKASLRGSIFYLVTILGMRLTQ